MCEKKDKILVVDDEVQIRKMLNIFLTASDFVVESCESGKQALRMSASVRPDLILLDLGCRIWMGKEVIATIREWSQVPIVVLSGRTVDGEVISALDAGGDDYVIKPVNTNVLVARIKANLRKAIVRESGEPELINGEVRMDLVRHEVFLRDEKIDLTPKGYELLRYLMVNRGRMLTHKQILNENLGVGVSGKYAISSRIYRAGARKAGKRSLESSANNYAVRRRIPHGSRAVPNLRSSLNLLLS